MGGYKTTSGTKRPPRDFRDGLDVVNWAALKPAISRLSTLN